MIEQYGTPHAFSLALTLALATLLIAVPRKWAMMPFFVAVTMIPSDQRIIIGGLDFTMLRILVLVGAVRLLLRDELRPIRWTRIDALVLSFVVVQATASTVLWGTTARLVNQLGTAMDVLGVYFFSRFILRTWTDILFAIYSTLACMIPLALFMAVESATGRNLFSAIGGVPAVTVIRDGRLRCQGAFAHPIMAGMFAASSLPLLAGLWTYGKRTASAVGVTCALAVAMLSASSTPIFGVLVCAFGLAMWPARHYLSVLRWGVAATLVALHLIREQPVWHLLARINILGGSTGWHRYWVIDQAINHFSEWWLLGTTDITSWNVWYNDITNEYVLAGVNGGILALVLLVWSNVAAFVEVGRAFRSAVFRRRERLLAWAFGVALLVHVTSFLGVSYFGQMRYVLNVHMAIIASVAGLRRSTEASRRRAEPPLQTRAELGPDDATPAAVA